MILNQNIPIEFQCSGIYKITNIVNEKVYVGSAVNIRSRWRLHKHQLIQKSHHSIKLQRAVDKYGIEVFDFSIIEFVENKSKLIEQEQYWIDNFKSYVKGYNSRPIAASQLGKKHTSVSNEKNRIAHLGKKQSEETIEKRRKSLTGIKRSEKTKALQSQIKLGVKQSEEHKRHNSECRKGKPISAASIEKREKTRIENRLKAEQEGKQYGNKGIKHSPEQIEKRRASLRKGNALRKAQGIPHANAGKKQSPKHIESVKQGKIQAKLLREKQIKEAAD